ncbi:MAG: phosphatidylserine decarboxylase [Chloroflexaceae bacterium]
MSEQIIDNTQTQHIPGIDAEATPFLSVGLGLTGLALGLRPRLAPLPLALTALTALLYRDPERQTPTDPTTLFAGADGTILEVNEFYEHRFLHTDALCIATGLSPFDVPVQRSPVSGTVTYVERVSGDYRPVNDPLATEQNTRTYIGIETAWGPLLLVQIAGPVARRIVCRVQPGDQINAGERIGTVRFGARLDLIVQRDSLAPLVNVGQRLTAGVTRIAHIIPL